MTLYLTRITVSVIFSASILTLYDGASAAEWEPSSLQAKRAEYSPRLFSHDATKPEIEWLRPITIREIVDAELKKTQSVAGDVSEIELVEFEEPSNPSQEPDSETADDSETQPEPTKADSGDDSDSSPPSKGQESVELDEDEKEDLGPFFRKSQSSFTWIPRGSKSRGIGQISLAVEPTWGLDFESANGVELDSTLGGGIHFLSGTGRSDLPPRVYDFFHEHSRCH